MLKGQQSMYEQHFGMKRRPFRTTPQLATYFASSAAEEAFATLKYCVEQGRGIAVLTGRPGTGKTLLCHRLATELSRSFTVAMITNTNLSAPKDLLQAIMYDLTLPYRGMDEQELRLSLTDHLLGRYAAGGQTVVIIDEAQNLPLSVLEELRMLDNLEGETDKLVHLVLAGQLSFSRRLRRDELAALRERIAARATLGPMSEEETAEFIRHQLRWAGVEPDAIFTPDALMAVYEATEGNPRQINRLCEHCLLLAFVNDARRIDGPTVEDAYADLLRQEAGERAGELAEPQQETNSEHEAAESGPVCSATVAQVVGQRADESPSQEPKPAPARQQSALAAASQLIVQSADSAAASPLHAAVELVDMDARVSGGDAPDELHCHPEPAPTHAGQTPAAVAAAEQPPQLAGPERLASRHPAEPGHGETQGSVAEQQQNEPGAKLDSEAARLRRELEKLERQLAQLERTAAAGSQQAEAPEPAGVEEEIIVDRYAMMDDMRQRREAKDGSPPRQRDGSSGGGFEPPLQPPEPPPDPPGTGTASDGSGERDQAGQNDDGPAAGLRFISPEDRPAAFEVGAGISGSPGPNLRLLRPESAASGTGQADGSVGEASGDLSEPLSSRPDQQGPGTGSNVADGLAAPPLPNASHHRCLAADQESRLPDSLAGYEPSGEQDEPAAQAERKAGGHRFDSGQSTAVRGPGAYRRLFIRFKRR